MYGLLLFISTLAFVPHGIFFLAVGYSLMVNRHTFYKQKFSIKTIDKNLLIILSIIVFCLINKIIFWNKQPSISYFIPYTSLMILSYFISKQLRRSDLKVLIFCVAFECVVVIIEFAIGINTFIPGLESFNESLLKNSDLLYYRRPLGLSDNSSLIAYKIFLAFLLLDYIDLRSFKYQLLNVLLLIGMILTFNRTVLFVILIFIAMRALKPSIEIFIDFLYLKVKSKYKYQFILGIGLVSGAVIFCVMYFTTILYQLTRDNGIDLSGRDIIWRQFWEYIGNHFWLGNGSEKYYTNYFGEHMHAHNSILQIIANHGILIASLFLFLIFFNIKKSNFVYVFTILLYSMTQYGIFWGVSVMDIIFFMLLFRNKKLFLKNCDTDLAGYKTLNYQ